MASTIAAALVAVLVLQAMTLSSARLSNADLSLGRRKILSEVTDETTTLGIEMRGAFHVDSPYGKLNLTPLEKLLLIGKSSKQRLDGFSAKNGSGQVYNSPVEQIPDGASLGYNMDITLGTPPRTYQSVLDTGSDLIWIQCEPCDYCFEETAPIFNPSASSTYSNISCEAKLCDDLGEGQHVCSTTQTCIYAYEYGDYSSTAGFLAYEDFTLTSSGGSTSPFKIAFGCGVSNADYDYGNSFNGTDGIVGLGRGPLSLISQLGTSVVPVFSYCLVDFNVANNKKSLLLLGSAGTLKLTQTPLIKNKVYPSFYYVNVTGITVNSKPVSFPAGAFNIDGDGTGGTILDSGTTLTYIPDGAYLPFTEAISKLVTYPLLNSRDTGLDYCYNISGVPNPTFPDATFQLVSVKIDVPKDKLFYIFKGVELNNQKLDAACLVVQNSGDAGISIIGNILQQNYQVAYDVVNNQVGFAPTTC